MRARLCALTHWIGITFCLWSMRLQGSGPGPWPREEVPAIDMTNVFVVSFRE
ncbi:hypothetical protein [Tsuneonella sp. HG222]